MNNDYQLGYNAGYADFSLFDNKPNTNGYTLAEYQRICKTYTDSIYAFYPTDWQRGYGDGADERATEKGFNNRELTDEEREMVEQFM